MRLSCKTILNQLLIDNSGTPKNLDSKRPGPEAGYTKELTETPEAPVEKLTKLGGAILGVGEGEARGGVQGPENFFDDERLKDGRRVIAYHATDAAEQITKEGLRVVDGKLEERSGEMWVAATDAVSELLPFDLRQSVALQMDGGDLFGIDVENTGRYRLDSKTMLAVKIDPRKTWVVPGYLLEDIRHSLIKAANMVDNRIQFVSILGGEKEYEDYLNKLDREYNRRLGMVIRECMTVAKFLEHYQLERIDDDEGAYASWELKDPSEEDDAKGLPLYYQSPEMYLPLDKNEVIPPSDILPFASNVSNGS